MPSVSVGLPVYNGEKYLRDALDSILTQDFDDFELIISDNASTDNTSIICQSYVSRDKRIRYFRNATNIGAAPNHNRVFELATGTYFKWAAHDDVCKPHMLRRCVDILEHAPPSVALVYPRFELIDNNGDVIELEFGFLSIDARHERPHKRLSLVLSRVGMGTPMYGLMRAEVLRKTRLIDSFCRSDYVLLAELSMLGELWEVPETLLSRRLHAGHSAVVNPTRRALTAWLDPSAGTKWDPLPLRERLVCEYFRSACRLPMKRLDRMMCLVAAPSTHYLRRVVHATRQWKRRLTGLKPYPEWYSLP